MFKIILIKSIHTYGVSSVFSVSSTIGLIFRSFKNCMTFTSTILFCLNEGSCSPTQPLASSSGLFREEGGIKVSAITGNEISFRIDVKLRVGCYGKMVMLIYCHFT